MIKFLSNRKGFTLVEIMVTVLIVGFVAAALMTGMNYIKAELNSIHLKERAFEELRNYTEYWRARIAAGQIAGTASMGSSKKVNLIVERDGRESIPARLRRSVIRRVSQPGSMALVYEMTTSIEWGDPSYGGIKKRKLEFNLEQFMIAK